jgi:hypothetical protein
VRDIPGVAADFASEGLASAGFASGEAWATADGREEKLVRRKEKTRNFD